VAKTAAVLARGARTEGGAIPVVQRRLFVGLLIALWSEIAAM
jgi:hypothetical protein